MPSARLNLQGASRMPVLIRTASYALLLTFFSAASGLACTSTWNDGNSNWSSAANWIGGVPTSASDTCINNGSTVTLDVTGNTGTLTVASGNVLNMGSSVLNVNGTAISNAGTITNNDGVLQLGSGATLSGGGTLNVIAGGWVQQASGGLKL